MKKLLACLLLVCAMVALSVTLREPSVAAQGAQKDSVKKDDKVPAGTAGTIEISEGKDSKFRFSIRNAEGKYLGGSGPHGFATEKDARAAFDDLKKVLATAKVTLKKADDKKDK